MEELLQDKPLYAVEQEAPPATVCVTGACGYIASAIVARLLAAGHTVHATVRASGDCPVTRATLQHLAAQAGAGERLRWFQADLLDAGSWEAPLTGCRYVIHTAGAVHFGMSHPERIVRPAVQGVANVLRAVNRCPSVERVVMTSSLAAVMGNKPPGHLFTEEDWNLEFEELGIPYFKAKTLSEWEAWAIAGQQDRWRLVTCNPAVVYGPPLSANANSEVVEGLCQLLDGTLYPFMAPMGTPTVDLRDVAAAHCLALVQPQAHGRYVLCERNILATEMCAMLRDMYPSYWVPHIRAPYWLAAIMYRFVGAFGPGWLRATYDRVRAGEVLSIATSEKAARELGLDLIPLEKTLRDSVERLKEVGLLRRIPDPRYVHPDSEHARGEAARHSAATEAPAAAAGAGIKDE